MKSCRCVLPFPFFCSVTKFHGKNSKHCQCGVILSHWIITRLVLSRGRLEAAPSITWWFMFGFTSNWQSSVEFLYSGRTWFWGMELLNSPGWLEYHVVRAPASRWREVWRNWKYNTCTYLNAFSSGLWN